jgi:REP element-mobilizing transposase RayT
LAMARAKFVDATATCTTARREVRRAVLLSEGVHNRKEWLEKRLEELAGISAVAVGGFSVMNDHLHLLQRLDPEVAQA